jgi:hypothetical protein
MEQLSEQAFDNNNNNNNNDNNNNNNNSKLRPNFHNHNQTIIIIVPTLSFRKPDHNHSLHHNPTVLSHVQLEAARKSFAEQEKVAALAVVAEQERLARIEAAKKAAEEAAAAELEALLTADPAGYFHIMFSLV